MNVRKLALVVTAVTLVGLLGLGAEKIKAGFIYVGPIGDYGWSHAHDVARRIVEEKYDWLETVYVESVPEGEVETYIDQLVRQGCNVIFTTSFGFMDGTFAAAQRYPNVIFAHASGFKRAPNMATYMADFYQVYYLNGLMAGALTKTEKVGYVAAFPIPELKRHISAFAIGVREVNPTAEVHVRWIYEWYNPAAAKEATEALIAEGCDVFAFTEDSPTVVQVAAERGLPSFAHYSPMYAFAPDHVVSGQLVHWEVIYDDFLAKIHEGIYTNENLAHVDYWWLLAQGAVELGAQIGMPVNPKYEAALKGYIIDHPAFGRISVYDLVSVRYNHFADPGITFDPFEGPVYDRKGNLVVPEGMWMGYDALITMEWAAAGVVGPWPGEP
ncbi:MAG TPA: BMP family ABC transporter substrate-binding protein [Candidatus Acetothermia bacterium]|nr:BMP family ABC transporter substrate-binding protein [Candidatus Acetothermia bacterium]